MSDIRYAVVPAGGADIMTVNVEGAVYVPMRAMADVLGVDWGNESRRISKDPILGKAVVKFTTAFSSGQEVICLPLTHFHGWLFKLNLNTVNERARPIVEALQSEGYQVLHDYWVKGGSTNPRATAQLEHSERTARRRELPGLLDRLKREKNGAIRHVLHAMIVKGCESEGITPPGIEDIGREAPTEPDIVEPFWHAVGQLEAAGVGVNHSRRRGLIALNLKDLAKGFTMAGMRVKLDKHMRDALRGAAYPKFIGTRSVNSNIRGTTVSCWLFERDEPMSLQ